jgi:hypothetical protein
MLTPSRTLGLAGSISPRAQAVATRMPQWHLALPEPAATVTAAPAVAGNASPDRAGCPSAMCQWPLAARPACDGASVSYAALPAARDSEAPQPRDSELHPRQAGICLPVAAAACQWAAATGNGPREGGLPRADCSILSRRATAQLHASHFGYLLPDKLETWSSSGATAAGQCKCSSEVES